MRYVFWCLGFVCSTLVASFAYAQSSRPEIPTAYYIDPPLSASFNAVPKRPSASVPASRVQASALFTRISAAGGQAVVGLKSPGANRGVWRATRLIGREAFAAQINVLERTTGVQLLYVDPLLPRAVVKLKTSAALDAITRMTHVDYVEPVRVGFASQQMIGCNVAFPTWPSRLSPQGDVVPRSFPLNGILGAWNRGATGLLVSIGIVDTGLSRLQSENWPGAFDQPPGLGRTMNYNSCTTIECLATLPSDAFDQCNHGTRIASTIGAPMNGASVVGVAFASSLIVQKAGDNVLSEQPLFELPHLYAIRSVRERGARIIEMAFGSLLDSQAIGDEIRFQFYRPDLPEVLFVAAAGTQPACLGDFVAFPARMPEVLAVTGVNRDGTQHVDACTGPSVRIAAVLVDFEVAGMIQGEIVTLGGSSGASAIVAGAAALVWSKYPDLSRDQVVDRLISKSTLRTWDGRPILDAHKSTGGVRWWSIDGPRTSGVALAESYPLTALVDGEGPFAYLWNTGETTQRITRVGPGTASVVITDVTESLAFSADIKISSKEFLACRKSCDSEYEACKRDPDNPGIQKCRRERELCYQECQPL